MSRCLACLIAISALAACSQGTIPLDAGTDAGAGGGSGGGGGGAGGGVANDDLCDFNGPRTCPTGSACTLALLPDGGVAKRCLPGACDLIDQDCDAGFKCSFLDGGRACVPDGVLNEGQACAGAPVSCRAGLACTLVGTDGGSACSRFCREDIDCGMPMKCYVTLVLPETNERPLVCADPPMTCDPLLQNCVVATEACYPGMGGPGCFPAGMVANDAPCTYSNDCMKGSACTGSAGAAACKQLCAFPSGTPACDAGTCTRLSTSQSVGVCL